MKKMALALAVAGCMAFAVAGCGDDDEDTTPPANNNTAGSSGSAGAAGSGAGAGGSDAGSGGTAGPAGTAGTAGSGGSAGKNAFETYGAAFLKVRDSIVANTAAELGKPAPGFGPSFGPIAADPAKLATLQQNLGDFLVFAYGGPNNYKGKSMKDSHAGLAITQAQYDFFLVNQIVKALTDNGVPQGDVDSCFAPILTDKAFIADIVTATEPAKGPGASLKCASGKNAFDTYGVDAFLKVNDSIIGNVAAELGKPAPGFGPSFGPVAADPAKLATLKQNLGDFLVFAYGGPNNYKGKSMKDSHAGLDITQAQYDFFLTNQVVKALTDNGVPEADVTACFAPPLVDKAFLADIVTKLPPAQENRRALEASARWIRDRLGALRGPRRLCSHKAGAPPPPHARRPQQGDGGAAPGQGRGLPPRL
jgi:truncated hemoglobin YjbI